MGQYIAIVEDEEDILELEKRVLEERGFAVRGFSDGQTFLNYLNDDQNKIFDLIILDIMLPGIDGSGLLRKLKMEPYYKKYTKIPVIMVTAKNEVAEKVVNLEIGADDYISKPFETREFYARVNAVLRRSQPEQEDDEEHQKMTEIGEIKIDENRHRVLVSNEAVDLTAVEFRILSILSKKPGWVYQRNKIIDKIWNNEKYITDRTIDVHIRHLREKLGSAGNCIKTVRGVGYKIEL